MPKRGTRLEFTTLYTMLYNVRNLGINDLKTLLKANGVNQDFDEDQFLITLKSRLKGNIERFIFGNKYTKNYINAEYGTDYFKPKFDFTMELLFELSDKFSAKLHGGRKKVLTIKEVQKTILKSSTFGSFSNKYDYSYQTVRRFIKKVGVILDQQSYNSVLESSTSYIKKQGIKERSSFSEDLFRVYMRYIFNAPFEKSHPPWLSGMSIKGADLELDGYNEDLMIAFEVDGPDHYDESYVVKKYGISLKEARKRIKIINQNDNIKDQECSRRNIKLIRVKLYDVRFNQFQSYVEVEYEGIYNVKPQVARLDYRKAVRLIRTGFLNLDFFL